ncbi:Uncharacterised protein [uncultured archaeon]|nr:Uncharacterised protein [uncultured archaeon]
MAKGDGKASALKGNSLGASGFTLAIVGIVSLGLTGIVCSILGFIFCLIQQRRKPTKLAKAGIILSIIAFILSIVFLVYLIPLINQILAQNPLTTP